MLTILPAGTGHPRLRPRLRPFSLRWPAALRGGLLAQALRGLLSAGGFASSRLWR